MCVPPPFTDTLQVYADDAAPPAPPQDLFAQYALAGRVTQSVRAYRVATMVRLVLRCPSGETADWSWAQQYMGAIKGVAESRSDDIIAAFVRASRVPSCARACC